MSSLYFCAFPPPTNLNAHVHKKNTVWFTRLEKELEVVDERVEKIRRVVKAVVQCDLKNDPPIEKGYDVQYDLINSCFFLCVAAKTHEGCRQGILKLAKNDQTRSCSLDI